MEKEKGITIVALVVTVIILIILAGISLNVTIGENGIITKTKQAKQNITLAGEAEAIQLNQLYYELEIGGELSEDEENSKKDEMIDLLQKQVEELQKQIVGLQTENTELNQQVETLTFQITDLQKELQDLKVQIADKDIKITELKKQVSEKEAKIQDLQKQLNDLNSLLLQANVTADKILSGYKAYSNGKLLVGTMKSNGALNSNLDCGQSYTIPAGYTSGGKVTTKDLASQTEANAITSEILKDKTAWVKGKKITGTMNNQGAIKQEIKIGGSYKIPAGYHNGNGTVNVTHVLKSWCPNYGQWINSSSMYTTDDYSVNATSLYVLARVENGGSVSQKAAPSCSNGTVTLLINNSNGVLYYITKTADAKFTLTLNIDRSYSSNPNATLKVYGFVNN